MQFLAGGNIHINNLEKIATAFGHDLVLSKVGSPTTLTERIGMDKHKLEKFCKENNIASLAIFGSALRDDFKEDSDIDILIELKKPVSLFEFADIETGLKKILKTQHKLDVVTKNGVSHLIADEIEKTSEVLYDEAA